MGVCYSKRAIRSSRSELNSDMSYTYKSNLRANRTGPREIPGLENSWHYKGVTKNSDNPENVAKVREKLGL